MSSRARSLVDAYEGSLTAEFRRTNGVHYTPPDLARLLVERAISTFGHTPRTVCDPSCGSGAFLLAAADALHDRGIPAEEVVTERLVGGELDPAAADVAAQVLSSWAEHHGADVDRDAVRVVVGDSLFRPRSDWPGAGRAGFDLVVGNPPFLGQLSSRSARDAGMRKLVADRFGPHGAYADTSALFLLCGLDLLAEAGVVALVQPQSFLAARDTAAVRDSLLERGELVALWASDEQLFDAAVRVCAPIVRRRAGSGTSDTVEVLWRSGDGPVPTAPTPGVGRSWGPLLAGPSGIPPVGTLQGPRLGDVAATTAGFRDEFYALTGALVDRSDGESWSDDCSGAPRLISVGMIDVGRVTWGSRARRIAGEARTAPRVDMARLSAEAPRVAAWSRARLRPKVLVATQTRVVEAAVDAAGDCVPLTPTISVEPHEHAPSLWHLAAALQAPPVSAAVLSEHLGAGLSSGALRWSAKAVAEVPLPVEPTRWDEGAQLVERLAVAEGAERDALLAQLGVTMTLAYGLSQDDPVVSWWLGLTC